jgi:hypothetical protein
MNRRVPMVWSFSVGYGGDIGDVSDDIHPFSNTSLIRPQALQDKCHIHQSAHRASLLRQAVLQRQDSRCHFVGRYAKGTKSVCKL